ncbi:MAG: VOC family protein [Gluconacetobacter diazotrophicus]|nr:VOC family protein [Gluconacetobacter diazotrophicus]
MRPSLVFLLSALLLSTPSAAVRADPPARGIPGARDVDHVGLTVPDLDQAVKFFVDVLGADLLWTDGPTSDPHGDSMAKKLGVDPRASMRLAMLRLGPNLNVELLEYHAPDQNIRMPLNSDVDVPHLAFYVDDVEVASKYLEEHGCYLLGGPNVTPEGNPRAGQVMRYAVTPWRFTIELVHRPDHMPYEKDTDARLYGPAASWK